MQHKKSLAALLLGLAAAPSFGAIVVTSDITWGANSIITDTDTNIQWLSLANATSPTTGLSEQSVSANLSSTYAGWTIATSAQAAELFTDYGLPISVINSQTTSISSSAQLNAISTFINDFGSVSTSFGTFIAGMTLNGSSIGYGYVALAQNLEPTNPGNYGVYDNGFQATDVNSTYGTFLIRQAAIATSSAAAAVVPAPAAIWLFVSAVAGYIGLTRKRINLT